MSFNIVTTTELQKQPKKAFKGKPIQVVLANNKVMGILFTGGVAQKILDSGLLEQLHEELWELQDKETRDVVTRGRLGKGKPIAFEDFRRKYGV